MRVWNAVNTRIKVKYPHHRRRGPQNPHEKPPSHTTFENALTMQSPSSILHSHAIKRILMSRGYTIRRKFLTLIDGVSTAINSCLIWRERAKNMQRKLNSSIKEINGNLPFNSHWHWNVWKSVQCACGRRKHLAVHNWSHTDNTRMRIGTNKTLKCCFDFECHPTTQNNAKKRKRFSRSPVYFTLYNISKPRASHLRQNKYIALRTGNKRQFCVEF